MSTAPTILTRELTKRFGAFTAVDGVSLEVHAGEVFGFLGSNGCGKTTTIRMLCGLLRPSGGTGSVAGFDIARQAEAIRARTGYVAQFFNLYGELTVRENLEFYGGVYGVPRRQLGATVDEWIGRLELGRWQSVRARNLST
ncbi:MAG: ABC transporter ATP-binding protein, partial [Armatimonadetes bacterium]|nr:ABC transporter ATP-binding protein [Armatimonadota bacterium]